MISDSSAAGRPMQGLIVGANPVRLWGMTSRERLRRSLQMAGISKIAHAAGELSVASGDRVLIVSDAWVFDAALIRNLAVRPDVLMVDAGSGIAVAAQVSARLAPVIAAGLDQPGWIAPTGLGRLTPAQVSGSYNHELRKREAPYLLRLTAETLAAVERRTFGASYKGVTDVVTKYVWPRPAQAVTRLCAQWNMTPNQVTTIGFVLTLLSFWLFWRGEYAGGLLSAWLMTFLDTVDGKLARVTLTSSKIGGLFDHGIDLIHPPFWWWAWVVGLPAYGRPFPGGEAVWIIAVLVVGYVVQRLLEGIFERLFGMHVHVWRRFDSRFRLWTARRNPNLLILTPALAIGRPDTGIWLVAAWTLFSLAVHALQIVQGLFAQRRGPLQSWLNR